MKNVLDYLKLLDLSEIEAKMYTALLETGPMNINDLAHSVGIKRSTAYFYVDPLVERGLFVRIVKKSQKLIAVNDPDNLQHLVKEKSEALKRIEQDFPEVLKTITTALAQTKGIEEAEIRYYKGKSGVKKIYEEALTTNELRLYARVVNTRGIFSNNVDLFNDALKQNPNLTVKELLYDSPSAKKAAQQILSKSDKYAYKFIPNDTKLSLEDILIYDGKVAIINYNDTISSIVLKSISYYRNSKELFDFIWKILP